MADMLGSIFNPTLLLGGSFFLIISAIGVCAVLFRNKIQTMVRIGLLKKYPIKCHVFELRANMPVPVTVMGAARLPEDDGPFDVLRLQNGDKIRVFGFKNLYSCNGQPTLYLLRVGRYEYHVIEIVLHEVVGIPAFNNKGEPIYEEIETPLVDASGNPLLDEKGKQLVQKEKRQKTVGVQTILFRPRVDEDIMVWVIRELRRSEERRRNKTLLGQAMYLLGPLILSIALMIILKGTLDPLVQLATTLGPDIRELAAALRNVAVIAAGPKPPI